LTAPFVSGTPELKIKVRARFVMYIKFSINVWITFLKVAT